MTMWEAFRALLPMIVIFIGIFGSVIGVIYYRAEFAVALARETEKEIISNYVTKGEYDRDMDNIDGKLDYIIQMHMDGKKK